MRVRVGKLRLSNLIFLHNERVNNITHTTPQPSYDHPEDPASHNELQLWHTTFRQIAQMLSVPLP